MQFGYVCGNIRLLYVCSINTIVDITNSDVTVLGSEQSVIGNMVVTNGQFFCLLCSLLNLVSVTEKSHADFQQVNVSNSLVVDSTSKVCKYTKR